MGKNTVNTTFQDWLYYREFGQGKVPAPVSVNERLAAWLQNIEKQAFNREVEIVAPPDRLDNPPQSLKEIIEQRIADKAAQDAVQQKTVISYRTAIRNGVVAGVAVAIIFGLVFLIKSAI